MSKAIRGLSPSVISLAAGIGLSAVTVILLVGIFPMYSYGPPTTLELLWVIIGMLVLGSASVFPKLRYNVISPLIVIPLLYIVSLVLMWKRIQAAYQAGVSLQAGPSYLDYVIIFWFVPLSIALVLGGIEFLFRQYAGVNDDGAAA